MIQTSPSSTPAFTTACMGDSGSSLVCMQGSMPIVAGVASFVQFVEKKGKCGNPNQRDFWVNTMSFLPWIKQAMVGFCKTTYKLYKPQLST